MPKSSSAKTPPPWEKKNPQKKKPTHLSEPEKKQAKASAKKAGRSYPNLVDNMKVARQKKGKS